MNCTVAALLALAMTWAGGPALAQSDDEAGAPGCVDNGWLGTPARAIGQDYAGSRTALVDLLSVVPDTPAGLAGVPVVSYADLDAIVRAGFTKEAPNASVATMPLGDTVPALRRASTGPSEYLQNLFILEDTLADTLGIGTADVRRGLDFGRPPESGMVLGLAPESDVAASLNAALEARGFEQQVEHGVAVRHRYEDNAINLFAGELDDPFWGKLGRSSRIFLHGPALAGTPAWPLAREMVAAAIHKSPSLADNPAVCALVAAASSDDGALLQFVALNPADTMMLPAVLEMADEGGIDLVVPPSMDGALPPYLLAGLADRFAGDMDEAVVALVYADRASADAGAAVMADRFAVFAPALGPDAWTNLLDEMDAEIAASVMSASDGGPYVAVVTITYRADFPFDETDDGLPRIGGRAFKLLWQALRNRELTPLVVL